MLYRCGITTHLKEENIVNEFKHYLLSKKIVTKKIAILFKLDQKIT